MVSPVMQLIVLFFVFLLIRRVLLKKYLTDTPAGAIVMACGIFINGALKNMHRLNSFGETFAIMLFLLWIFIAVSYINSIIKGKFHEIHLKNPIKSFAIGTWVAGTSVCGIAIFQRVPFLLGFSHVMFYFNVILWIFYLSTIIRGYRLIFKNNLLGKANGVLLMSTVSTQSLIVFGSSIFGKRLPIHLSQFVISLGVLFYIVAFVLVMRRYFFLKNWSIEEDWTNTNCIIHGAMSITGLASVSSHSVNGNLVLLIWLWILVWFIIVELIELNRAFRRSKKYGFIGGVGVYDITQWSRIFTFGMFYTFTMNFNLKISSLDNPLFQLIRDVILRYGTWVMVCILIIEGIIFFKDESVIGNTINT